MGSMPIGTTQSRGYMKQWYYDRRCCSCGRFCKVNSDVGIPFGSSQDVDPPDEEYWCTRCAKKEYRHYLKQRWIPVYWCHPKWIQKLADKLGYIEIFEGINAWSVWHDKTKPIPKGWLTTEERYKDMR